jgi:hypothetical protein
VRELEVLGLAGMRNKEIAVALSISEKPRAYIKDLPQAERARPHRRAGGSCAAGSSGSA